MINKETLFFLALVTIAMLQQTAFAAPSKSSPSANKPNQPIPPYTQIYMGSLPIHFAPAKFSDASFGYRSANLIAINSAGKRLDTWIHEQRSAIFGAIFKDAEKMCKDKGYTAATAASDVTIDLDTPMESFFMLNYSYQVHCW